MAEEKKTALTVTEPKTATKKAVKKEETANGSAAKKTKTTAKKTTKKAAASTTNKTAAKKAAEKTSEEAASKPVVAETKTTVAAAKAEPAKAADATAKPEGSDAAAKSAEAKPEAAKEVAEKKAPAKKTAAKKTTTKKAAAKKTEEPAKETAEKKEPAKKTVAKKTTTKKTAEKKAPAKKTAAKKTTAKKTAEKTEAVKENVEVIIQDPVVEKAKEAAADAPKEKEVTIKEVKKEKKEPAATAEEKASAYKAHSLDLLLEMAHELGLNKTLDDYKALLSEDSDLNEVAAALQKEATKADELTFEEDGYDIDLIPVLISRIYDSIDWTPVSESTLKDQIEEALKLELGENVSENSQIYHTLFDLVRDVLMIAQQNNIYSVAEINDFVQADVPALIVKFMDIAYDVLKTWQYNDVKYYEGFIYSVLSQFEELHQAYGNRAMMDVADQLIIHGDFGLGDANYHYIIRENNIKDMIYFRFANVYRNIDRDKARSIAQEALQWVDGRYDYYNAIIEILNS